MSASTSCGHNAANAYAAWCRYCCKSPFALVIKISFGCTRDFHGKMWGTSSREDKLAGDLVNAIEPSSIGGRRPRFFTAGKLAPDNLGLLQQYLPLPDSCTAAGRDAGSTSSLISQAFLSFTRTVFVSVGSQLGKFPQMRRRFELADGAHLHTFHAANVGHSTPQ
jgi:hypothetical protein